MINLIAKLVLDATGFQRGLASATDGARKAGGVIGEEVGKDFKKGLKRTLGAGALFAGVISIGKEAQEIRNMAAAVGVTAEQYAAMERVTKSLGDASNVSAEEVKRLADELIAAGEIPTNEALNEMAKAGDILEKAFNNAKAVIVDLLSYMALVGERMIRIGRVSMLAFTAPATYLMTLAKGGSLKQAQGAAYEFAADTVKDVFAPSSISTTGGSIAERATRIPKEEAKEKVKAEKEERQKSGSFAPIRSQSGSSLASIGLGPGLGQFSLQRVMVEEQKKTVAAINKLTTTIKQRV